MPRHLDPELLRTFVAIVEDGSFRRAAGRVGRTQAAVSMQVQRLEDAVGHRLFNRERPWARLTPKGEALLGYARRILSLQEEALATLSEAPALGTVRFGAPDDYAKGILPGILARFSAEYPRAEIEIRCETSARLIDLLGEGELDLAIITRMPGRPTGQFFRREPLVWASSVRQPVQGNDPISLALFQPDCMARQLATTALGIAGRPYRIAYSSPNLAALLAVVEAGLAVAALPLSSVPDTLKILRERDGFPPLPDLELGLLRASSVTSPAVEALANCIIAAVPEREALIA